MTQERKTAGLLPRPVWLIVRPDGDDDQRRALGPIRTLERLRGVIGGIYWASAEGDEIEGFAGEVPEDCKEINVDVGDEEEQVLGLHKLQAITFEQQLVNILWFDYDEGRWDEEKEWNADRWQDVGMLLESFDIEFPGADAPKPPDAEEVNEEDP
jgi:hypothetical protein